MKKKTIAVLVSCLMLFSSFAACAGPERVEGTTAEGSTAAGIQREEKVTLSTEIKKLADGFSAVRFEGDYGFEELMAQGGASSDGDVVSYLREHVLSGMNLGFLNNFFGCSTITAKNQAGDTLFGRNFDWNTCDAMVIASKSEDSYGSIATVNMDFISQGAGGVMGMVLSMEQVRVLAALYAPLDGMNEAGLAVSVNMIQDGSTINQQSDKPDVTTTTAVRLLLNQAANVDEALTLLKNHDLHASMGMMIHFALADTTGRSVVVEYINNEMVVTETPVVTNFYLATGEKHGIGTAQSHQRYEILMNRLEECNTLEVTEMRDALDSVSKDNFEEFASTEWSIVFNLQQGIAYYYHREDYEKAYIFSIQEGE